MQYGGYRRRLSRERHIGRRAGSCKSAPTAREAVDSAGSGISVGEPGAANLHLLHARPSTQQGAAYRSASRELHICTSTDALISDRRPLGHDSPRDSPTHALACVLRTMDGASRLADFVDENLCKPNGNTVLLPTTSPSLPNHYLQPSAPF